MNEREALEKIREEQPELTAKEVEWLRTNILPTKQALAPQEQLICNLPYCIGRLQGEDCDSGCKYYPKAPQECDETNFKFDKFDNAYNQIFELAKRINDDCINADGCSFKKGAFVGKHMMNCLNIMRDEHKQLHSQQKDYEQQLYEANAEIKSLTEIKEFESDMRVEAEQEKTFTLEEVGTFLNTKFNKCAELDNNNCAECQEPRESDKICINCLLVEFKKAVG